MSGQAEISAIAGCVLDLLRGLFAAGAGPMAAREIASRLRVAPNTGVENQRREVRKLIAEIREAGHRVCECNSGYWLARDAAEWAEYQAAVTAKARFTFVRVRKVREAVVDRMAGQGGLFGDLRPHTECFKK